MLSFLTIVWLTSASPVPQAPAAECATRDTCHAQALIAEAAGEYERFHDLAWRAMQKGKANDPELMLMLSRAMALSGRPGDAIVMISRLADMGVTVDASGDEYAVVRTLKGWPDVEAKVAALPGPPVTDLAPAAAATPAAATPPPNSETAPTSSRRAKAPPPVSRAEAAAKPRSREPSGSNVAPKGRTEEPNPRSSEPNPGTVEPDPKTPEPKRSTEEPATGEPFSYAAPPSATSGLAYDAVSRRFLVGDPREGRLMVIDEVSHHVVPLVSAAGAGFYDEVTAFRIDARRGDLWVVSTRTDGERAASVLHKLQLVSGRPIYEIEAASFGDVRFVDVAVDTSGTVYALDAADSRIFRVRAGSRALELVSRIGVDGPTAFDVVDERTAIVAGSAGLSRVDLTSGRATAIPTPTPLGAVASIDARGRSLFVLDRGADGSGQLVRCVFDRTRRRIASVIVVGAASAIARTGNTLYYIAAPGVIKSIEAGKP
jgi:hypothetical protein